MTASPPGAGDEGIEGLRERVRAVLEAASEERYQLLREWEQQAAKWKREGDMYGWNFHMGMAAGANWCDIIYNRVRRVLDAAPSAHEPVR